eukprot:TRINITY_DN15330_c0_g1_i1.p1 TRINITY_DN15330_c0_g1~~TRINITY_DN15330_c0_g1_i1.p1  ORF type:complete len:308 (-),score=31.12 TRINITY_DN15330_c0_g1_i1:68-991(-)
MSIPTQVPLKLQSVLEIGHKYQGVLLDQYGVLHDGQKAYPQSIPAIRSLALEHKQKLLVISNSSRRSDGALNKISKLGFSKEHFCGAITSGEIAHQMLSLRPSQFWTELGNNCIHFSWGQRGAISLEGLDLNVVGEVEKADFILAHGTESSSSNDGQYESKTVKDLMLILERCACQDKSMPMIVANPDKVTVQGTELALMPGTLAEHYASIGGEVHLMGKPDKIIYDYALDILGVDKSKLLAIGDSLEHDIKGAQKCGIDTLFVVGGIHADELNFDSSTDSWDQNCLDDLLNKMGLLQPTYIIGKLQ